MLEYTNILLCHESLEAHCLSHTDGLDIVDVNLFQRQAKRVRATVQNAMRRSKFQEVVR